MRNDENMILTTQLEAIRQRNGGILRPVDVVEAAADEEHPLHDRFVWNDSLAAHRYRLWQARELIAVAVKVMPRTNVHIRAYVSLLGDRDKDGGGYREITTVLEDDDLRDALLAEALAELKRIERRYRALKVLEPVFAEARKVQKKARQAPVLS